MDLNVEQKKVVALAKARKAKSSHKPDWTSKFLQGVAADEGRRDESYRLSYGKGNNKVVEPFLTAGVGHRMTPEEEKLYPEGSPIPNEQVMKWLAKDSADAVKGANDLFKREELEDLNSERKLVIGEMMYQMGVEGTNAFSNMIGAMKKGDFDKASKEILNSKWARQTPDRAKRAANRMKNSGGEDD